MILVTMKAACVRAAWAPFVAGLMFLAVATARAADAPLSELTAAAKSGAAAARLDAIDQLGERGEKAAEAVGTLTELLADPLPAVRAHAALALGRIGAPAKPAAEALAKALADSDPAVRRQAIGAIVAIRPGPQVMIPLFIKLMGDADDGVRMRVLSAVADAGEVAVPGLILALKNEKSAYWACLVLRDIGPAAKPAVPALLSLLKDPRADIRNEALLALGAIGVSPPPVVDQIATLLDDEHSRTAATFVLGQLGAIPPPAEAKVRAAAKSGDKNLSTVSLWALARAHPQDKQAHRAAAQQLIERLKEQDPFVRVVAARALSSLPPAPELTLPLWEKAMAGADEATVHHALDALAAMGPAALPRFVEALKHEKLRMHVAYILGQIGPPAAPATEALAKLIGDQDPRTAHEAIMALGKIGPSAAASAPALAAAFEAESPNAHAIAYALGQIGSGAAAAEPKLAAGLAGKDRSLAIISAWALGKVQRPSAELAAKTVPVLTAGLADELPQTRQLAVEALGSLGPLAKSALPAVMKAAKDENAGVRAAAAQAIRQIGGQAG